MGFSARGVSVLGSAMGRESVEVVEVVAGRSVTFHQGTCLVLESGVVLFHRDGSVDCLLSPI